MSHQSNGYDDDEYQSRSRRAWLESQGLHQRPVAAETTDAAWNDWCNKNINIAIRVHAKQTQEFVISLLRENNKSLMRVIDTLRTEVDALRKQLDEEKPDAKP
jgi:hypothetical protein